MSIISVKTIVYRTVIGLLQGWPALYSADGSNRNLVRSGTLVRLDLQVSNPPKLAMGTSDGDYPQLIVVYGGWRFTGDSGTPRMGDQLGGKPSGRVKTLTLNFQLTLTHRDLQAVIDDALEAAVIDALESAGPTLGVPRTIIPFVQRGDIDARTADVTALAVTRQMKGTQRAQTTFVFPVVVRWQLEPSPTQTV